LFLPFDVTKYLANLTTFTMGVQKTLLKEGNGVDRPKKGDKVSMEYTGWLYDPSLTNTGGRGAK
jgi:FKBP-type peptidyl-prolyl cis-trans isomerase